MSRPIVYYFSLLSTWSYLGAEAFAELVRRHNLTVHYKPMNMAELFPQTGGIPVRQRHVSRLNYRLYEMQRWAAERGLTLDLNPPFWPFDFTIADKMVVAAVADGKDPERFTCTAMRWIWAEKYNLADPATLIRCANESGLDGAKLHEQAQTEAISAIYAANTAEAVTDDAFGAPTYILDGEPFWGQDRLTQLDAMLTSGRPAFRIASS